MHSPAHLRGLVERYLEDDVAASWTNGGLGEAVRYALAGGGKRLRPVLCLAVAETAATDPAEAVPAAAAVELVHTFSLVHDDLPALDDDDVRRGRPSIHVRFGEAVAILTGDALLAEALRLALSYPQQGVAAELSRAALDMIRGQYLDVTHSGGALEDLYELKTGALFSAATVCGLHVAGVPEPEQKRWRSFAREFGLLFQVADDIADGDGVVAARGDAAARALAGELEKRARAALETIDADTSVVDELLSGLSARTGGR